MKTIYGKYGRVLGIKHGLAHLSVHLWRFECVYEFLYGNVGLSETIYGNVRCVSELGCGNSQVFSQILLMTGENLIILTDLFDLLRNIEKACLRVHTRVPRHAH